MATVSKGRKKPAGSSPGSVVYVGVEKNTPVTVTEIRYAPDAYEPPRIVPVHECRPEGVSTGVVWYTVDGVHNVDVLKAIGENFRLHPLVVEDIGNTTQRPKLEGFDGYYFLAAKMITYDGRTSKLKSEHVSIVFGHGFLVLFLQDPEDLFAPIRQRLEAGKGRIRAQGSDYLAYALVDAIVDYYFHVLEEIGDRVERLEDQVVSNPTVRTLRSIHDVKRELIALRRSIWPMREVVNAMIRDESPLVSKDVKIYLRDLYDHTIHVIDSVETMRDIITGTLDVYLSSVSNRLNQVMKVLTVMSSIFIPLTFIVGVYGMNFHYMPELEWRWGYPAVWLFMIVLSFVLLVLFRRKNWM
ncbi:MAG: magnesium transport protein CorA [Pseudomonadota bacterium]|jgi:magnesium transporter